ncbi:uncharacterized protein CLUP02_12676 [Colletotrichum lupini]|uniref:Uncharacterized protein n=1 Tax=Colletotrichum lupini TaxID=145971 RepID=A0A9Q8WKX4_9PEZI|nr:uncharacterized protein CLUP02_12676 [Colletotrichum lupini]UQC87174.1 hypothetical protein CLUP02_12676 [Colletotrichum lupini]
MDIWVFPPLRPPKHLSNSMMSSHRYTLRKRLPLATVKGLSSRTLGRYQRNRHTKLLAKHRNQMTNATTSGKRTTATPAASVARDRSNINEDSYAMSPIGVRM